MRINRYFSSFVSVFVSISLISSSIPATVWGETKAFSPSWENNKSFKETDPFSEQALTSRSLLSGGRFDRQGLVGLDRHAGQAVRPQRHRKFFPVNTLRAARRFFLSFGWMDPPRFVTHVLFTMIYELPRSLRLRRFWFLHKPETWPKRLALAAGLSAIVIAMLYAGDSSLGSGADWSHPALAAGRLALDVLARMSAANVLAHGLYNSLALAMGWPLLMVTEEEQPIDPAIWYARTGQGSGRISDRALLPSEVELRASLQEQLVAYQIDPRWAEMSADTFVHLRGDSLRRLYDEGWLDAEEAEALSRLDRETPSSKLVDSLGYHLALMVQDHVSRLQKPPPGYDEAFLSTLLSRHLMPWSGVEKLQRMFGIGLQQKLPFIQKGFESDNVEERLRELRQSEPGEGSGRLDPALVRRQQEPLPPGRAMDRLEELERQIRLLDFLREKNAETLSYRSLSRATSKKCTIRLTDPNIPPIQAEQIVRLDGYEFVVMGYEPREKILSLRVASPDLRDVSQIRGSGKIAMGESDLPLEKEYERLRSLREAIAPAGKMLCQSAENPLINRLLGLPEARPSDGEPPVQTPPLVFINPKVAADESQRMAVEMSFDSPKIMAIDGPAATGKTGVDVEIAEQWARRGKRVLYIAHMHHPVDEAASRMTHVPILRLGNRTDKFEKEMEEFWPGNAEEPRTEVLRRFQDKRRQVAEETGQPSGYVVMATNVGIKTDSFAQAVRAGKFQEEDLQLTDYDLVIMDEDSVETFAGAQIPLEYLAPEGKLVVIGDLQQTGPRALGGDERRFAQDYLEKEIRFSRKTVPAIKEEWRMMVNGYGRSFHDWVVNELKAPRITLTTNYRQLPLLGRLTSETAYKNEVHVRGYEDFGPDALRVVDLANLQAAREGQYFDRESGKKTTLGEEGSGSYINQAEAIQVVALVREKAGLGYPLDKITVLTPFTGQMILLGERIDEMLKQEFPQIEDRPIVTTIDRYQGRENRMVIFCTTRNNADHDVGLLKDVRRITVGISRAEEEMVVVLDSRMLSPGADRTNKPDQNAARDYLERILKFYRREVLIFYPPRKIGAPRKQNGAGPGKNLRRLPSIELPEPGNLEEAIRYRGDELLARWTNELLAPLREARSLEDATRVLDSFLTHSPSGKEWPLAEWWRQIFSANENSQGDDKRALEILARAWGRPEGLAANRKVRVAEFLGRYRFMLNQSVDLLDTLIGRTWTPPEVDLAEGVEVERCQQVRSLVGRMPAEALRARARERYVDIVRGTLSGNGNDVEILALMEPSIQAGLQSLSAAPRDLEAQILSKDEVRTILNQLEEAYRSSVKKAFENGRPDWDGLQTRYDEGSAVLQKVLRAESLSWCRRQISEAGTIPGFREARNRVQALMERVSAHPSLPLLDEAVIRSILADAPQKLRQLGAEARARRSAALAESEAGEMEPSARSSAGGNSAATPMSFFVWQLDALRGLLKDLHFELPEGVTVEQVAELLLSTDRRESRAVALSGLAIPDEKVQRLLKNARVMRNPTWADDFHSTMRDVFLPVKPNSPEEQAYRDSAEEVQEILPKGDASLPAVAFAMDADDLNSLPDDFFKRYPKVVLVTCDRQSLQERLDRRYQGPLRDKIQLVEGGFDILLDKETARGMMEIADKASSLEDAERQLSALWQGTLSTPHLPPGIDEKIPDLVGHAVSYEVLPMAMVICQFVFERRLLRRLIQLQLEPDQSLPATMKELRIATIRDIPDPRQLVDPDVSPDATAFLLSQLPFLAKRYEEHLRMLSHHTGDDGIISTFFYMGQKVLMEGIPDRNDDEAWDKAPYALNHAISVWGRSLQKLHESTLETYSFYCCRNLYLFIDALVKAGDPVRIMWTLIMHFSPKPRGSLPILDRVREKYSPSVPGSLVSVGTSPMKGPGLLGALPVATGEMNPESSARVRERAREATAEFLSDFRETVHASLSHVTSPDPEDDGKTRPSLGIFKQDVEQLEGGPVVVEILSHVDLSMVPTAWLERLDLVFMTPDAPGLAQALASRGSSVAARLHSGGIRIQEADLLGISPALYGLMRRLIDEAKDPEEAELNIARSLNFMLDKKFPLFKYEYPDVLGVRKAHALIVLNLYPQGAAVWGLTLERLIARRFGLPEPQEVSDCPSFRMVEGEKGEPEISYFMYFIKELMTESLSGQASERWRALLEPDGTLYYKSRMGRYHFSGDVPDTLEKLSEEWHRSRFDFTDPIQWFGSVRAPWLNFSKFAESQGLFAKRYSWISKSSAPGTLVVEELSVAQPNLRRGGPVDREKDPQALRRAG